MLLHGKMENSTVNGPGNRAVLWFSGCTLNCPGCHNPSSHKFDATKYTDNQEIRNWIMGLENIEGITFSGGEPLQNVGDLIDLATFTREVRPDLSIGMFTGYTQRELESGQWKSVHPVFGNLVQCSKEVWFEVAKLIDFAVMGRFNASKMTFTKPLCGSSNQDIVMFSDRYSEEDFKPQMTQVTISESGLVKISGYPGVEFLEAVSG